MNKYVLDNPNSLPQNKYSFTTISIDDTKKWLSTKDWKSAVCNANIPYLVHNLTGIEIPIVDEQSIDLDKMEEGLLCCYEQVPVGISEIKPSASLIEHKVDVDVHVKFILVTRI